MVQVAFGNNSDTPSGENPSNSHMDFLISKPIVTVINKDISTFDVFVDGTFKHF
jgi:hypothetical protein